MDYMVKSENLNDNLMENKVYRGEDNMTIEAHPIPCTGTTHNCGECCAIFTNQAKRNAFGYQMESAPCECHDICVEDVRDICVERRTLRSVVPCTPDTTNGCRGGFSPDGPPVVQSWRVLCAEECLSPATGCDRIINEVEFQVVLRYSSGTLAVLTPKDTFECFYFEFARFPSGTFFPNNQTGLNDFRNELAFIDGSCKVIIIENVRVVVEGNDCVLIIDYKVIDKLWKHENLLVSAIKPYPTNVTVKQKFAQGQNIGPCPGGPCNSTTQ
ncbi:MAG: hypothetical protein ACOX7H_06085 [Bacillota bacterium]|jgi:hypothetical protein